MAMIDRTNRTTGFDRAPALVVVAHLVTPAR